MTATNYQYDSSAGLNHWVKVTITLKHKETLATKDISFVNRAEIENADIDADAWPLIYSISRIGLASDRVSVLPDAGQFTIYNYLGSFGVDRKFTDLLERYAIVYQPVTVAYTSTIAGDYAPATYTTYFTGTVLDVKAVINDDLPTLQIAFDARPFKKNFLGKKITTTDFPSVDDKQLGKTLPVVIGAADTPIQVRPILISKTIGETIHHTTAVYAYAATLGTQFVNGGIQTFYARDASGEYKSVRTPSSVGDYVFSNSDTMSSTGNVSSNELAAFLEHDPATHNYVMTHVEIEFSGLGVPASYDGTLTVNIYEANGNDYTVAPGKLVATGTRPVTADYDSIFDGSSPAYFRFGLQAPLVMTSDNGYWMGVKHTTSAGPSTVTVELSTATATNFVKASGGQWYAILTPYLFRFRFLAMKYADTAAPSSNEINASGWAHSYFTLTESVTDTGWEEPDISTLDIVLGINGLLDDSSGTVTGSASSAITTAADAINVLQREWDGSTWTDSGDWDFSAYSDTHGGGIYPRTIRGATIGNVTFEQFIRELAANSASRIVTQKDGTLAVFSWGSPLTVAEVFDQENSKLTSWALLDPSYVLNRVVVAGYPSIVDLDSRDIAIEGIPQQFQLVSDWGNSGDAGAEALTQNSRKLYGERINSDQTFNWVGDDDSALAIQNFYFINYSEPPQYVSLETSIDIIAGLEPLYKVQIKDPNLPAFYGTSPNAKLPSVDGEEIDPTGGYTLTRAERYDALVEAFYIDFVDDEIPRTIITARLITHEADPT